MKLVPITPLRVEKGTALRHGERETGRLSQVDVHRGVYVLGPAKPRRLDEASAGSLEARVPASTFSRNLEAKLDLSFVRFWVEDRYAERGRPRGDPVVFFTLQLVMVFAGIRSERQLIATVSLNLAHRLLPGLCPRRGAPRSLNLDPYPAAAGDRRLSTVL